MIQYLVYFLIAVIFSIVGGFVGTTWHKRIRKKEEKEKEFEALNKLDCAECDLEILQLEWKTTIETQMHFNELIIKFRSIVLSVFIAGIGAIYGISRNFTLSQTDLFLMLGLAAIFWLCCFMLDFFYYHRLLKGAVKHACKFDEAEYFKSRGLLGLTRRISYEINFQLTTAIICSFYTLPIIAMLLIILLKLN